MPSPVNSETTETGGRIYRHPETGKRFPSVTTILGSTIAKPYLKTWGEGLVAERAVQYIRLEVEADCSRFENKPDPLKAWIQAPASEVLREASDKGREVHEAAQAILEGKQPKPGTTPERHTLISHVQKLVDDWEISAIETERSGYTDIYAGTFDAIVTSPYLSDGIPVLIDWKTNRSEKPNTDVALQLHAYTQFVNLFTEDGGTEPMPKVSAQDAYVFKINLEGARIYHVDLQMASTFWPAMLKAYEWNKRGKHAITGPLHKPDTDYVEQAHNANTEEEIYKVRVMAALDGEYTKQIAQILDAKTN